MAQTETLKSELHGHLKSLHMPTIRSCYSETAAQAGSEDLSYEQYLLELVRQEVDVRWDNRVKRYLRASRLPLEKSLENFDMSRLPKKVLQQVHTLLTGDFVNRNENVLAFGNPGSGKTHLLCALGRELIRKGRQVYFTSCSLLVQDLLLAKRELALSRLMKKLSRFDVIICDDIGYVQQERSEMEVFFTLLAERYERGSVMLSSNLPFSKWEVIFKDPMLAAAAIDRLVHHSVILELNLPSYRMDQARKELEKSNASGEKKEGSERKTQKDKNVENRAVAATAAPSGPEKGSK